MRYLGLDLGSSFLKGAVLDLERLRLEQLERVPFPAALGGLAPGLREFDPLAVVTATRALLERLSSHAPDAAGVVVCSQLHGLVFTRPDGQAISNLINWQDQRALQPFPGGDGTYFDEVNRRLTPDERRLLGNEARPGVPICFLFWLAQRGALPAPPAVAASLPNFVVASLCGGCPKSDVTNAFAHGALNVETLNWHEPAIAKLGLEGVGWPEIVTQGTVLGEWRPRGRALPVFAPVGDYHCSQVGTGIEPGELGVNISTGSAVVQLGGGLEFGDFQTRPFFDGQFLRTITHIPGGRALDALVRLLSELGEAAGRDSGDPWDYVLAQAAKVELPRLRVNPAFYFSALGDRGAITDLREEEMTVGHLFRATFEAMADNYCACARRIRPAQDWTRVVFSGGVARKVGLLRQRIAVKLGLPDRLCAEPEDTLLGLLTLALVFSGRCESVQEAMAFVRKNHQPDC